LSEVRKKCTATLLLLDFEEENENNGAKMPSSLDEATSSDICKVSNEIQ